MGDCRWAKKQRMEGGDDGGKGKKKEADAEEEWKDVSIKCLDCSEDFLDEIKDQQFRWEKGFADAPKRCKDCRWAKKQRMEGGDDGGKENERRARIKARAKARMVARAVAKESATSSRRAIATSQIASSLMMPSVLVESRQLRATWLCLTCVFLQVDLLVGSTSLVKFS